MLRKIGLTILFFVSLLAHVSPAVAQENYPSSPVKVIVTFTAGGGADFMGRVMSQKLSEILKQPFIVDNKLGASGAIGSQFVAQSKPDGYTLLLGTTGTHSTNFATIPNLPYHPIKDFTTIAIFSDAPFLLCLNPQLGINSIAELVRFAKANPGKLTHGSSGIGSSPHLGFEALKKTLGIDVTHIPYKGVAPAMADVLGGQVPIAFASLPSALSNIRQGQLRALGVSTPKRSPSLPDVPAMIEQIPGFSGELWVGLFAIAGTPPEVVNKVYQATATVMQKPAVQKKLMDLGLELAFDTPAQFKARLDQDIVKWGAIVKASGAKVD
jgi:tripartite-type tricarboxylate transporter receptor subunit TctC